MTNQAPPDGKLADLTKSGEPIKSRVSDPKHALKICQRFVNDDRLRAARRAKVQGAFDGNAPKAQGDLIKAGRGNDSNLNFKRHRGNIMNAWTPFFDMVCEVPLCIDGDLDYGDAAQDAELMRGFAEYFHSMVFNWRGFDDMSQLCDLQMLLHGPGVLAWEDSLDWRPKAILAGNIYFPDGTELSLDNCEMAMVFTPMSAGQLWRKIENEKAATAAGWNVEAVKQVIMDSATNGSEAYGWNREWQRWNQAFKNGDIYVTQTQTKRIQLSTLFVEEMDGTISQKIVPAKEGQANFDFIFDSQSRYEGWDQCICLFPYDIGADGTYHSIKGLGTDIYPFCALLNQIDNSIADLVVTGIKPMWQPTTNAKLEDFKMVKWGGGNFIPNGINPLQLNMSQGINPALEVSAAFTQTLIQNTAASNQNDLAAPTVEETAKGAMIRAAERAKVSKGLHNRYMRCKDRQYSEMWRRATNPDLKPWHSGAKEALKFQERCYKLCDKLGVEHKALQAVTGIRANRSLGLGSAAMRIEIVNQLMANIDRFDEVGQNELKRQFVSVMTSFHSVDAIVPSLTTGRDATNDAALAAQEDNGFSMLGEEAEAMVVPGQNHVIHLEVHIPSMQKDMAMCQAGEQAPEECDKRLEAKGKHAGEHLAKLAGNPTRKREYKQFKMALDEMAAFKDQLEAMLEQQAEDAPPPPDQPTPEMAKVQGNLAIKAEKEQATMQLREQKQAFDQQMKLQQAQFDAILAKAKQDAKIAMEDADTAASINRSTAESRAYTAMDMEKAATEKTDEK
jgi:hypothetical protein